MRSWRRTFAILALLIVGAAPVLASVPAEGPTSWVDQLAERFARWVQVVTGDEVESPSPPPVWLPEDPMTTGCVTCSGDGGDGDSNASIDPDG